MKLTGIGNDAYSILSTRKEELNKIKEELAEWSENIDFDITSGDRDVFVFLVALENLDL
jgi:hypothetical protein